VKRLGHSIPWLLTAALVLTSSSCKHEKEAFAVTGRLLENGSPIKVSTEGLPPGSKPIQLIFHAMPSEREIGSESYYCDVDTETGEFTAKGRSVKGIPAGRYRISVTASALPSGGPASVPPSGGGGGGGGPPGAGPPGAGGGGAVPGVSGANPGGVMGMQDRFKDQFSPVKSSLSVEITGPTELVIEVGKNPGVTKQ
jgi:hypothetical protein